MAKPGTGEPDHVVTKIIHMLPESLFKKEMVSVLDEGKDYSPTFIFSTYLLSA